LIEVSRQSRRRTAAEAHHETVVETYCTEVSACDAATGFVAHIITVALAAAAFFMWLAWCLKKPIVRKARHDPRGLVPAAGTIVGRVVGRTELCLVIMRAIRNRDSRRPHLLVDGVGTGKTAVLVQLTEMLAEYRAVPVPIRSRDVETDSTPARWRGSSSARKSNRKDLLEHLTTDEGRKPLYTGKVDRSRRKLLATSRREGCLMPVIHEELCLPAEFAVG
jgi:hypothetical protein